MRDQCGMHPKEARGDNFQYLPYLHSPQTSKHGSIVSSETVMMVEAATGAPRAGAQSAAALHFLWVVACGSHETLNSSSAEDKEANPCARLRHCTSHPHLGRPCRQRRRRCPLWWDAFRAGLARQSAVELEPRVHRKPISRHLQHQPDR